MGKALDHHRHLACTRLTSARYPYYLLADSPEGRSKEGEITGRLPLDTPTSGDIRQGFVYERAPHITLKSIANNAEIDIIWERWQEVLEPLRAELNGELFGIERAVGEPPPSTGEGERRAPAKGVGAEHSLGKGEAESQAAQAAGWQEWEIPRDLDAWRDSDEGEEWAAPPLPSSPTRGEVKAGGPGEVVPPAQTGTLPLAGRDGEGESEPQGRTLTASIRELHAKWWEARIARQQEIDAAIARAADVELLYDRPYEDKGKVRVVPVR